MLSHSITLTLKINDKLFLKWVKTLCFILLHSGRAIKRSETQIEWIKYCFCTPRLKRVVTISDWINFSPNFFSFPSYLDSLSGTISHVVACAIKHCAAFSTNYTVLFHSSLLDSSSYLMWNILILCEAVWSQKIVPLGILQCFIYWAAQLLLVITSYRLKVWVFVGFLCA